MSEVSAARAEVAGLDPGPSPPAAAWPPADGAPPAPLDAVPNLLDRARQALAAGAQVPPDTRLRGAKVAVVRAVTPVSVLVGRVAEDLFAAVGAVTRELVAVQRRVEHLGTVTATVDGTIDDLDAEVRALRAEVLDLRAEVARIRDGDAPPADG